MDERQPAPVKPRDHFEDSFGGDRRWRTFKALLFVAVTSAMILVVVYAVVHWL